MKTKSLTSPLRQYTIPSYVVSSVTGASARMLAVARDIVYVCDALSLHLRAGPSTGNIDPFSKARSLLALDIDNVRVAAASASDTVLLLSVPVFPVLVFLDTLLFVEGCRFEVGLSGQLSGRRISGAVLDSGVSVSKVTEVVDVARGEEGAGCQGVDGGITPLSSVSLVSHSSCILRTYAFHPEASTAVHHLEELFVLFAAEPIKAGNFEVGPEMTHVVRLAFHGLGVDVGQVVAVGVRTQNFFGQRRLVGDRLFLLLDGVDEHLPQALGLEALEALVGGSISEDVGDSLAKFLDSDGETVSLVGIDHGPERITVW